MEFTKILQRLAQPLASAENTIKKGEDSVDSSPKPILRRLMIALSIISVLVTVGIGILLLLQQRHFLQDTFDTRMAEVSYDYQRLLNQQASGLRMALQPIVANNAVKKALQEGDTQRLESDWHDIFETMKRENRLTHFYFLDHKRVCLLRMHNPSRKGDVINRFTALEAEWTHKRASGLELGPMGTLTLRVIQPVYEGESLIGYIELGKEVEDILQKLHTQPTDEIVVLIRKQYLERSAWEEGMQMLGRKANWKQFPEDVVVYASQEKLPDSLAKLGDQDTSLHDSYGKKGQEITDQGKDWRVSMIHMKDASGKEIGDLIVMSDNTLEKSEFVHFISVLALGSSVVIGLILFLIFLFLRRTDANIRLQQTNLLENRKAINSLAFFDQLTNLPNRTLLLDRLKQVMAVTSRSGNYGALLFIDLDNFKTLNDTLGHDTGDMLLKQVAQRLTGCVREGDTVSRFGGDEFVVILSGLSTHETDAATASEMIAEKILASLNEPYFLNGINHRSSASIGVTLFKGDSSSIDNLMKQADLAMYKSKEAGRDGLSFFDPNMESALKTRSALEEDLRKGIDERQFVLYYQAQVREDGSVSGTEVLVRWQHPKRGIVSPIEFIPVAEETGLILPLGHWILKTACEQLARWARIPEMEAVTMAVNVSARQFSQSNFVAEVLSVIQETGANPNRLKLELTESLLLQNIEEVIRKMAALKVAGVSFSLDDFGTGYSSLSYLKRLPLDQLKIDQSFVRDIMNNENDAIICKSTIALSESMGLSVIAEGVETQEQRNLLLDLGCRAYQGYWFSRPVPLTEFEALCQRIHSPETAGES
ncbi:putative bifunctional diguanylate cyclase/phosphodiesterase [Sulfuricurvum sp.]|uniref:putative bifunctional diguanylate cyclase/phosphodiesterase n=1 Tax=Sulfuricurvum sp. TaxID=2025608 RepID=UPI003BAECF9A